MNIPDSNTESTRTINWQGQNKYSSVKEEIVDEIFDEDDYI